MARDPKKLYWHDRLLAVVMLPIIPRFISPNQITVLRFLLIPLVLWQLAIGNYAVGAPLFLFAAFTDALDGSVARVRKQITRWGTFYDPVADKMLIGFTVLLLISRHLSAWLAAMIVLMELMIAVGGFVYRKEGKMQSANAWGKGKMFTQVCGVSVVLISLWFSLPALMPVATVILCLSVLLAAISFFTYGL